MKLIKKILPASIALLVAGNSYACFRESSYTCKNKRKIAIFHSAPAEQNKFWRDGVVNYIIDQSFTEKESNLSVNVMNGLSSHTTGLSFHPTYDKNCDSNNRCTLMRTFELRLSIDPRNYDHNHIYFKKTYNNSYCGSSYVGMKGGRQELELSSTCIKMPTILHEIMHAIGFHHEQQRYDRDRYVIMNWDNIPQHAKEENYKRLEDYTTRFGYYDYNSIMHYTSYSKYDGYNGAPLLKKDGSYVLYNTALSDMDIEGIKKAYPSRKY